VNSILHLEGQLPDFGTIGLVESIQSAKVLDNSGKWRSVIAARFHAQRHAFIDNANATVSQKLVSLYLGDSESQMLGDVALLVMHLTEDKRSILKVREGKTNLPR